MSRLLPADLAALRRAPRAASSGIFVQFAADQAGATAIEYSMIAAGVGVAISAAVWSLGTGIKTTFYDKLSTLF
jgi:Flp pilus assembly pilin Flp